MTQLAVHSTPRRAREDPSPTTIQWQVHRERMSERVLRSNPDKTNLLPQVSSNKQEDTTIVQVSVSKPLPVIEDPGSSIVSEHKQFLKGSSIMSSVFP